MATATLTHLSPTDSELSPSPGDRLRPQFDACASGWYCLRARGRGEQIAAANLVGRVQIDAFAPRIRVRKQDRSGKVNTSTEALFPGYLFARFRYPDQVRHVLSTTGVVGLVAFGGPPPLLPDSMIEHLRRHAGPVGAPELSPVFDEGDWVRVAHGCFRGAEGRVRHTARGQDRVCVLLNFLGHDVEISIPARQLTARGEQPRHVPAELRTDRARVAGFGA